MHTMNERVKVSIITVCRNDAEGLKETIDSVKSQTYRNFEFLITDGASTDNTITVIKDNATVIDNWISEADSGIYNAMNKSLKRANGEYVIFMNSGDCFFDSKVLETVFKDNPSEDVVYGDVRFDRIISANREVKTLDDFFCKSPFCHQGVFTKLDRIKTSGFREEFKIVADWVMFTTLFMKGCSFKFVPCTIAQCKTGGVSADAGRNNLERLKFLEEEYSKRITEDYKAFNEIKNGVLFNYYRRIEATKKLKYYILSLLKLLHIKPM